jgi:hypothetical protein
MSWRQFPYNSFIFLIVCISFLKLVSNFNYDHFREYQILELRFSDSSNMPICTVPSWSWSYGSSIYNYLCNQCLSPIMLWVRIPIRRCILDTILLDKVRQWLGAGRCIRDRPFNLQGEGEGGYGNVGGGKKIIWFRVFVI